MPGLTPGGFYTTKELADCLRLTPRTVQRWIDAGQLPAYRFGRKYRVRGDDFEAFLHTYKAHHPEQLVTDTVTDTHAQAATVAAPSCHGHVTDTATDTHVQVQDVTAAALEIPLVTDTVTDTVSDTAPALEPFDTTKFRLGKLCLRGHEYESTGQSLRINKKAGYCLACNVDANQRKRARQRQATAP